MAKKAAKKEQEVKNETHPAIVKIIRDFSKPVGKIVYGDKGEELKIKVYPHIDSERKAQLVRFAAELVFIGNKSIIEDYNPAFMDFAIRYSTIVAFTDLKMPEDLSTTWALVLHTPLFGDVAELAGVQTVQEFAQCIINYVEAQKQCIYRSNLATKLVEQIGGFIGGLSEIMGKIDLNKILKKLENFDMPTLDGLDISKLIKTLSSK